MVNSIRRINNLDDAFITVNFDFVLFVFQVLFEEELVEAEHVRIVEELLEVHPFRVHDLPVAFGNLVGQRLQSHDDVEIRTAELPVVRVP